MRPHDHIGWTFAGPAGFAALARPFLAEGAARGERLMYVAADPDLAAIGQLRSRAGHLVLHVVQPAAATRAP